jgi:hypothetical protein
MADIELGGGDTASFVVCSRDCEQRFKHHPRADEYISEVLSKVHAIRAPSGNS